MSQMPSGLLGRSLLAVALMVGFYALAVVLVVALAYLPYAEYHFVHRLDLRLVAFAAVGAFGILAGIMPRIDRFQDPGPRLEPADQPRLFDVITGVATATGQEMPKQVFLVPDLNAWVAQRGGVMGIGSHRVMGIGLPLLGTLSVAELRAVLAHEFGHFHGGDTALGPWLYKTRAAIDRTVRSLAASRSWVQAPFVWYGNTFLRITHAVSRRQELAADALAASITGPGAVASGLKKLHATDPFFQAYWQGEVVPVLGGGFRPPLSDGFALFLAGAESRGQTEKALAQALSAAVTDPYDTHPPLRDRLAALPAGTADADTSGGAIGLLQDPDRVEQALLAFLAPDAAGKLRPVSWEALNTAFWLPLWESIARGGAERLAGLTPAGCEAFAGHPALPAVRFRMAPDEAHAAEQAVREAQGGLAMALAALLHRRGWVLEALPGQPVVFTREGCAVRPFDMLAGLLDRSLTPLSWRETWASSGLADEDLGALAASLPAPAAPVNATA